MQSTTGKVVVLGTGGTIAGRAADPNDLVGYKAAELSVEALVAALPSLVGIALQTEQIAQLDSKDMDAVTWQRLAQRAAFHLARDEVVGVVVTHGTDTLEETAWWLHRLLAPSKALVLTAAMRPASAAQPDGPRNLADAIALARHPGAAGVLAVLAGAVHGAADLRKQHTTRLDAFSSGDAGPLARIERGVVTPLRAWPSAGPALGLSVIETDPATWPWIAVVANHEGSDGREVAALRAAGVDGLVVAGTGNGSLSMRLEAAMQEARQAGLPLLRASRCANGAVVDPSSSSRGPAGPTSGSLPSAGALSPWQARIELLLQQLASR